MATRDSDPDFKKAGGGLFEWAGSRLITLSGCLNCRDVGGVTFGAGMALRPRMLFRTSQLHNVDSTAATALADGLGIRTFVDLRTTDEINRDGSPAVLESAGVQCVNAPILSERLAPQAHADPSDYARIYLNILRDNSRGVRRALMHIANGRWPLAFGCSLGKDRTGVVTAVILLGCGASLNQIGREHSLSARQLRGAVAALEADARRKNLTSTLYARRLEANGRSIILALNTWTAEAGGVESALAAAGLREAVREIRSRLSFTTQLLA
jgi:protein-tyrosine phosphatase